MANGSINTSNTGSTLPSGGSDGASVIDLQELEKRIYRRLDAAEKQADDRQMKSVEVLGIFMAFLSFIAVNVQIFSRVSSAWSAGLFILLFFCALSTLVVLINLLLTGMDIKGKNIKNYYKELLKDYRIILIIFFVSIGVISIILLRNFSLNPVQGTLEFEDSFDKRLDEKVEVILQKEFYSKSQIDEIVKFSTAQMHASVNDFKKCLNEGMWKQCLK